MTKAAWLKAMENGGLGEARARAFLMERFWVLERSVDIEGADYLIQRKITSQNFLDRDPPRLGLIQVKYIQDGNTSISINKDYLCDSEGSPYSEFFLLVFTGREDDESSYLLSSAEVLQQFGERVDGKRTLLAIRGAKLIATSNYEVVQKRRALDRIERALANADFMSNRRFLSGTNYIKISPDHIDEDLIVPLDNLYGDLSEVFFEEKKKVQLALFDIEEVAESMRKILRATDPEEALCLYDDVITQHVGGGRRDMYFSADFFNDEDFFEAVRNHKSRLDKLRQLGVLENYVKLLDVFEREVVEQLADMKLDSKAEAVRVTVTYDSDSLRNAHVEVVTENNDQLKPHVAFSQKGRQVIFYGLAHLELVRDETKIVDIEEREEILRRSVWKFRRPFQAALDTLFLGTDLVAL